MNLIFGKKSNKIITIDGEYGSGATEIAKNIAEKLSIEFYDDKVIELMSLEGKVKPEDVKKDDSFLQGTIYDLYRQNYSYSQEDMSANDAAFLMDSRTIREIARGGSAVIFGKCANFVLKDDDIFSVFIYAQDDFKKDRVNKKYNIKEDKVELKLSRENNRRANHYSRNTGEVWGSSKMYDLLIDSSVFDFEVIESLVIDLANKKK
ncbi:AAA family ATPase [Peptoniphilus sp.]|uniref:cytidylate kinase-like family protein n=1 Tax=Peptoniphilus sp. TaxID=1971214 RepID=UPI003D9323FF